MDLLPCPFKNLSKDSWRNVRDNVHLILSVGEQRAPHVDTLGPHSGQGAQNLSKQSIEGISTKFRIAFTRNEFKDSNENLNNNHFYS